MSGYQLYNGSLAYKVKSVWGPTCVESDGRRT